MCGLFREVSHLTLPSFFIPKGGTTMESYKAFPLETSLTITSIDEVVEDLMTELDLGLLKKPQKRQALACVLANLKTAYDLGGVWVVISKEKQWYKQIKRYKPSFCSYCIMISIYNKLMEGGYTTEMKGFFDRTNPKNNRKTRIKLTPKLKTMLVNAKVKEVPKQESIYLTEKVDKKRFLRDYKDTKYITRLRITLNKINSFYEKNQIIYEKKLSPNNVKKNEIYQIDTSTTTIIPKCPIHTYSPIPFTNGKSLPSDLNFVDDQQFTTFKKSLIWGYIDNHKTFAVSTNLKACFCRNSFKCGGRFYTSSVLGLQNLKSEMRKYIFINGEVTSEYDYKSLHITMCYHSEGLEFEGDAYDIGLDVVFRPLIKKLTLASINAKDERTTLQVVQDLINRGEFSHIAEYKEIHLKDVLELIKQKHTPIAKYLCSDVGVKLQRKDARIMLGILKRTVKLKIVALPIHDSVLCPTSQGGVITQIMKEEYFNEMGFSIQVDKK